MQGFVREEVKFNLPVVEKHPLPNSRAIMPEESHFPKYLPEGSGHQTPFYKLGYRSKAETIDLLENKINSPSHSK